MNRLLIINPGSTSTKLAIFEDDKKVISKTLRYYVEDLTNFPRVFDQYDFRMKSIKDFLNENHLEEKDFTAFVGRGGLVHPIPGGTYLVDDMMVRDLKSCKYGEHVCNFGCIMAREFADKNHVNAYTVDPVVIDEMDDVARLSGHPDFTRKSIFHALNQRFVARMAASSMGRKYEDLNMIVVHLGGGISVGSHRHGKIVDVNNALNGDGPFSPERSGTLPITGLIDLCYSGKYTLEDVKKIISRSGGLVSYLGTNDAQKVQEMIESGNEYARRAYTAMAYQIVKYVGKMAVPLHCHVDAIVITGGLAHDNKYLVPYLKNHLDYLAKIFVIPGGDEESALAAGTLRVLRGVEKVRSYEREVKLREN